MIAGTEGERVPFFAIARHRMNLDGTGIVTLATVWGCPLRCRYCLNPQSLDRETGVMLLSPEELYRKVRVDDLYFQASGGGVTFGGGEPLLYPRFYAPFRGFCGTAWRLGIETSLNVPREAVELAAASLDAFIVDIKDGDSAVYRAYTGRDNERVLSNLEHLLSLVGPDRITVRIPHIPGYNGAEHQDRTEARLRAMGLRHFNRFSYRLP